MGVHAADCERPDEKCLHCESNNKLNAGSRNEKRWQPIFGFRILPQFVTLALHLIFIFHHKNQQVWVNLLKIFLAVQDLLEYYLNININPSFKFTLIINVALQVETISILSFTGYSKLCAQFKFPEWK